MKRISRLKSVEYVGGLTLRVVWEDGYTADVDMTGVLIRSETLCILRPDDFARVAVVDYGSGIAWPHPGKPFDEDASDRLDFSSSALREIARLQQTMTAEQSSSGRVGTNSRMQKLPGCSTSSVERLTTTDRAQAGFRRQFTSFARRPTIIRRLSMPSTSRPRLPAVHGRRKMLPELCR